jgi:hypothetical protein
MPTWKLTDKDLGTRTPNIVAVDLDDAHSQAGLRKGDTYVELVAP